ncbi:ParB N-terminal domain-containing protein [Anabaena sp. CA = ATCC 33047]|uniref:ParB N-terminal domain-containing protein n=1 Tax=Anabaena sp. (strain CA / ATCC 33047) TaxID=52271 RepID=UPI0008311B63|nr:hypothetical protein [Anabaena sp. CA = ATCC 33047]
MKLSISLIAVKKIISNKPRSLFADEELEQAAQLILDSEGVINPIVVRRNGLQSYEVVDGDFEYYAAARAREIDPRKGEMIGVFIIESENEENLSKQVKLFRKTNDESFQNINLTSEGIEKFLKNLESRIEILAKQLLEAATVKVKLEYENQELRKKLADNVDPLEVFTKMKLHQIANKLQCAGFPTKKANQIATIVVAERERVQFKSLNDVIQRVKIPFGKKMQKGISAEKMVDIIQNLSSDDADE